MELRSLGQSHLRTSPIVFGAWAIGGWMWGGTDVEQAEEAIRAAIENGVNMIDTAAIYGMGLSEEIVGRAVRGHREKVLIATKCGRSWTSEHGSAVGETVDPSGRPVTIRSDSRPAALRAECEASLRRLGTDFIDLYQIHWPDTTVPIEDAVGALAQLKAEGKIGAIGVSNFNLEQLRRACSAARIDTLQPPYSLLRRGIEADLLPFCREHSIGVLAYSPLERGLLTGTVDPARTFPEGDHRNSHKLFTAENRAKVLTALKALEAIAARHSASYAQLAIRWTIDQPGITAAVVGSRSAAQSIHNTQAVRLRLAADELAEIGRVFEECSEGMVR